jgi:hypothetical protein
MSDELDQLLARKIPEANCPIRASRGQALSIWTKANAVNFAWMAFKLSPWFARQIPQSQAAVGSDCD